MWNLTGLNCLVTVCCAPTRGCALRLVVSGAFDMKKVSFIRCLKFLIIPEHHTVRLVTAGTQLSQSFDLWIVQEFNPLVRHDP